MAFTNTQEVSSPVGVKDEGTVITGSVASLDFVGAGVSTAIAGGITTVTIPGPTAIALNDLNDTTITSASSGQILSYNSSAWVNTAVLTGLTSVNGLVITANTGEITTGIWSGTTIGVSKGGTGGSNAGIGLFNNITGYTAAGATGTTTTNLVFSTSPTLVTPVLGAATATTLNGMTLTTSTGTFTLTNSKTLTVSDSTTLATNAITFAGTEVLTLTAAKSVTFADAFITSGAFSLTLTTTGTTDVTLPTSGTLGIKNQEIATYATGTAYALTDTAAAINVGTTDPVIVLNVAGTYLIMAQVNLAYTGATVIAETAALKVRRTNNTATDLSVVVPIDLPVATTLTHTYGVVQIPPFIYTTAATDDSVTIFANVSAALGAGTIDATAIGTSIVAIRLY